MRLPNTTSLDTKAKSLAVLGEAKSFDSVLSVQRPTVDVVNPDGSVVAKDHRVTSHDQVLVHGKLESGAVFSINVRGGKQFKDQPSVDWRIYGEKGEIWIKAPNMHMQIVRKPMGEPLP